MSEERRKRIQMVAKQRAVSQRNAARRENQRLLEAAQEANGTRIRPTPQTQGARVRAHRRRRRRRRQSTWMTWLPVGIAILILLAVIIPIFLSMRHKNIDADTAGNQADWAANNSVMTGLDEFNKILPQLYENGYVLVNFDQKTTIQWGDYGQNCCPNILMSRKFGMRTGQRKG